MGYEEQISAMDAATHIDMIETKTYTYISMSVEEKTALKSVRRYHPLP